MRSGWPPPTTVAKPTVSDEVFKRTADSYRRIRNTARFASNLEGFDPAVHGALRDMLSLIAGQWIAPSVLQAERGLPYDSFQFHPGLPEAAQLLCRRPGGFYLDVIRTASTPLQADSAGASFRAERHVRLPRPWCAGAAPS